MKCTHIKAKILLSNHNHLYKRFLYSTFSEDKRSKMVDQQLLHKEKFALENRQELVLT